MVRRAVLITGLGLLAAGLGWWVLEVHLLGSSNQGDASGFGQFVISAAGLVLAVGERAATWVTTMHATPDIDELTDRLATGVRAQWNDAAAERGLLQTAPLPSRWRRCSDSVTGPLTAATTPRAGGRSFEPLPGLDRITPAQLRQGTRGMLHRIYGGLPSGRLIIVGGPGAGKSSEAILLLLDALTFRDHVPLDQRNRVPVPVLFTLHGWDPDRIRLHDWLARKITELSPFVSRRRNRSRMAQLLAAGRVAVFLDGLDEIPEKHRPTVLGALTQQATFRLVLLTRTRELADAAQRHMLASAVALELQPLTPTDAATYLKHGLPDPLPDRWQRLLNTLTPDARTPAAQALTTPLTISLVRDIYRPPTSPNTPLGTIDELLDTQRFPTPEHITNHLLDHAITTAYTPRPGEPAPRYTPKTAHRALSVIARQLRRHGTRDLAWWQISAWVSPILRDPLILASRGLILGPVAGIVVAISFELLSRVPHYQGLKIVLLLGLWLVIWAGAGLLVGLVLGFLVGLVSTLGTLLANALTRGLKPWLEAGNGPRLLSRFRLQPAARRVYALVNWSTARSAPMQLGSFKWKPTQQCLTLLSVPTIMGLLVLSADEKLEDGIQGGLVLGATLAFIAAFDTTDVDTVVHPRAHRRAHTVCWLVIGPVTTVMVGFAFVLMLGIPLRMSPNLLAWVAGGLMAGLVVGFVATERWRAAACQVYLSIRYRTPLRLTRFLDDAYKRHLLRTVGPVYQFRHATLQDRLAPPRPVR